MSGLTIDEKTKIPLYAALTAAGTIIGFSIWLYGVSLDAKEGKEAKSQVLDIIYEIKGLRKDLKSVKRKLKIPEEE